LRNEIRILKQRIDKNRYEMKEDYNDICDLVNPIVEMIDLLLVKNVSNDKIEACLKVVHGSIKIIEEKLSIIEKKDKNKKR